MDKHIEMSHLLDFYGALLSEKQRTVAELTYNQDLSLNEIGSWQGVTKQAVSETLRRAETALVQYENILGLRSRFFRLTEAIEGAASTMRAMAEGNPPIAAETLAELAAELEAIAAEVEEG